MREQPLSRLFSLKGGEENSSFIFNHWLEQKQQTDEGIYLSAKGLLSDLQP